MVAGAQYVRSWKPKNQAIRTSSATIISWIEQKNEFSLKAMEKALGLNEGQSRWHIKNLIEKGVVKRTNKYIHKTGKGQRQVIYRHIG